MEVTVTIDTVCREAIIEGPKGLKLIQSLKSELLTLEETIDVLLATIKEDPEIKITELIYWN